jgi:uncharacterized protein (TIGR02145 family)
MLSTPFFALASYTASKYLYNWYAVNTGKLAPKEWHVATNAEWTALTTYLGGTNVAGGKMKEVGINHWSSPNTSGSNECGFTALPSGRREFGTFYFLSYDSYWWSSTATDATAAWYRGIFNNDYPNCYTYSYNKEEGFAIRLIKD